MLEHGLSSITNWAILGRVLRGGSNQLIQFQKTEVNELPDYQEILLVVVMISTGPSQAEGPVVPGPSFEMVAPPFHVWPPVAA